MIRNFIWDFDGMLWNTYPHMIEAARHTLEDYGVSASAEEIFAPIKLSVGICFRHFLPRFGEDPDFAKEVMKKYHEWDDPSLPPHAYPFPQVPDLVRAICADGRKNYIYSHRDKTLFDYLDENNLRNCFEGFVTSDLSLPSKPAPDGILWLVNRFELDRSETLMLGDREIDVECGQNAGVHTCLFDEFGILPPSIAEMRIREHRDLYKLLSIPEILQEV